MNHCDKLFPAIYGNLDSETGFDTETVTITTISNRTDYVKLSNRNGNAAYMICDFTQWENLPRNSKRDHCKLFCFFFNIKKLHNGAKTFSKSPKNLTRYFLNFKNCSYSCNVGPRRSSHFLTFPACF